MAANEGALAQVDRTFLSPERVLTDMGILVRGQDRLVAKLIVAGGLVALGGLFVGTAIGWMGQGVTALQIWIAGFVVGLLLFVSGLTVGLIRAKGLGGKPSRRRVEGTKIVAVTALSPQMTPVWNEEAYADHEIARYVHLRFPDGHVAELRINRGLLDVIGEGMKGIATLEGDALVSFEPTGI